MPVWELAPYVVLGAAVLFALTLLIPPRSDWKYKAAGFVLFAGVALIILG